LQQDQPPNQEGTYEMKATSTARVVVESGGNQVAAHAGLHALGAFADRLGLGAAISEAIVRTTGRLPLHDRGKVMVHLLLLLAGGGESCADVEHLRAQRPLFPDVCSDTTLYRSVRELRSDVLSAVKAAVAQVRSAVWRRTPSVWRGEGVLDFDASLVEIHSENKERTGPTYKGGFGFHPLFCFFDGTGDTLTSMLRPGNAGANKAEDHLTLLDEAIAAMPEPFQTGHHQGEDPGLVQRQLTARADSAGCSEDFVRGCRDRNVGFSVVARSCRQIHAAISFALDDETRWQPAVRQDGEPRTGATVTELTEFCNRSTWPPGTRLIVRREPRHPGAQTSLFPSLEYRFWGFYTDRQGHPVELDRFMRAHAHVEDHIGRLKDSGLERFPFTDFAANSAWLAAVGFAADLVRWFQLLCLRGDLRGAEPKALRWRLWHAPARLVRSGRRTILRVLDGWPDADALLGAHRRMALIT
jgi:hypothetical protein